MGGSWGLPEAAHGDHSCPNCPPSYPLRRTACGVLAELSPASLPHAAPARLLDCRGLTDGAIGLLLDVAQSNATNLRLLDPQVSHHLSAALS